MSEDKILSKVRALLAQAEDPAATPEEAETFTAKAIDLMEKYSIDRALLEAEDPAKKGSPGSKVFEAQEPYGKAKCSLLTGIAQAFGCKVVRDRRYGEETWHAYGFESDLQAVEVLYSSLLLQGTNALLHQPRSDRSFRTSYWYAFAWRVHERLTEARRKAEQESTSTSTALVLADRSAEVERYYREQNPNVRKGSKPRVTSRAGVNAGTEAANRADLGGRKVSGAGRRALG